MLTKQIQSLLRKPYLIRSSFYTSKRTYKEPVYLFHEAARLHGSKTAVIDHKGAHSYKQLVGKSLILSEKLSTLLNRAKQRQVALLLPNDSSYVIAKLAIWDARKTAVPLHPKHPENLLNHCLTDSESEVVITTEEFLPKLHNINFKKEIIVLDDSILNAEIEEDPVIKSSRKTVFYDNALIIYTSGTTGPPKGVVLTQNNIFSQINMLNASWEITSSDVLLHCLPLNHVHGIVNALLCPLYAGGTVLMEPKFDPNIVWNQFLKDPKDEFRPTLFMGVPTMYSKLIATYFKRFGKKQMISEFVTKTCTENMRLMVSGSAPLQPKVFENWESITGHVLLERYGMTEIGMALTNPLHGKRKPGYVGLPLQGVQVLIAGSVSGSKIKYICQGSYDKVHCPSYSEGVPGELYVKSPGLFKEYYGKPQETKDSFADGGWFKTGDTATYSNGSFKILGRTSVDIIKSGGYKISALDIEVQLMKHPHVDDVAVFGLPDDTWGEKVAAVIAWTGMVSFKLKDFKIWAESHLATYQIPTIVHVVKDEIPRNHMGKINKKQLINEFFKEHL